MASPVAALIVRVAADLAELKSSVGDINSTLGSAATTAKNVASAIAASFSIDAIKNMATDVMNTTGRIQDAADAIGVSAEAVQRLQFAAEQGGASIDAVGTAIRTMAGHLQDPGKGATEALAALNLNIDNLRQMTPDQAFNSIAEAIRKVPDPLQQSAIAQDLLGKSAQQLLPAIKAGFAEIGAQAPVMADAVVKSGDDMGDAWAKTQQQVDNLKAQAMLPLLETFLKLPESAQVVVGAAAQMTPALSNIGIAIMAAGGPKAAFGALATAAGSIVPLFSTVIPAAGAFIVTLFTTTLPAAFTAILPFLGPIGLIAAGVAAVLAVWYNWDRISEIAKNVYTAVKTWLVDKFTGIVDSIKGKIDAVTGFFGDMYDKVVGNSYVPDMIARIAEEFATLPDIMVTPTNDSTGRVAGLFDQMASTVDGIVGRMLDGVGGRFGNFLSSVLPSFGSLLTGGLNSLLDSALNLAVEGIRRIGGVIAGLFQSDETKYVNQPRDRFFEQFGGYNGLAERLGAAGVNGEEADRLITNLFNADDRQSFNNAQDNILAHTGGNKFATGTPGLGFVDFGRGSAAMLHGREAVVPESRAGEFAARHGGSVDMGGVIAELRAMRRDLAKMPIQNRDYQLLGSVAR